MSTESVPKPDRFESFDLVIDESSGIYRARVSRSSAGRCAPIEIEASALEIETAESEDEPSGTTRDVRRAKASRDDLRLVGERLFDTVFSGKLAESFRTSLERVREQGTGLRLRLRFESAAGLAGLPWEALWDSSSRRFLADEPDIVIFRDLAHWERRRLDESPSGSLRIAALLPRPRAEVALSGEREWTQVQRWLEPLEAVGVEISRIEPPTRQQLGRQLELEPVDVLHIVAHGEPGAANEGGCLVLQDSTGGSDRVNGTRFVQALRRQGRPPRLIVLNACHSARARAEDAFDGLAQHLLRQGVEAVVAMRDSITDAAAVVFAASLYGELASGASIETAMITARGALIVDHPDEWATPALYSHAEGLRLFDPAKRSVQKGRWSKFWAVAGPLAAGLAFLLLFLVWRFAAGPSEVSETIEPRALLDAASGPRGVPLAEHASKCPQILDLQDLHFVWIDAGALDLGERSVTVEKGYCISTTEVSRRDWARAVEGPLRREDWPPTWPISEVLVEETEAFLVGLKARAHEWDFRLPTPDEWELAGRAGATTDFYFGADVESFDRYGNSKNILGRDGFDGPAPVASYEPNAFGLYDIHGNVAEWVFDPAASPRADDRDRLQHQRLGGSWDHKPDRCDFDPNDGWVLASDPNREDTGFRVVAVERANADEPIEPIEP